MTIYSSCSTYSRCFNCESEDNFLAKDEVELQGQKIVVHREYCNYCGYQAVTVYVNGKKVYDTPLPIPKPIPD